MTCFMLQMPISSMASKHGSSPLFHLFGVQKAVRIQGLSRSLQLHPSIAAKKWPSWGSFWSIPSGKSTSPVKIDRFLLETHLPSPYLAGSMLIYWRVPKKKWIYGIATLLLDWNRWSSTEWHVHLGDSIKQNVLAPYNIIHIYIIIYIYNYIYF
jgi:hypothetical protein